MAASAGAEPTLFTVIPLIAVLIALVIFVTWDVGERDRP